MYSNIQMLRALAAFIVVMHHAEPHYEALRGRLIPFYTIGNWGYTGVDIFFVISGFVIAHTTFDKARTRANALTFALRRLSRIYLGYWPFFFITLLIYMKFRGAQLEKIALVDSFFLTSHDMFELLLPVSWSLTFELYFYVLFAFSFALPVRVLKWVVPMLFAALLGVVLVDEFPRKTIPGFFLHPYLLEFFAGAILCSVIDKLKKPQFVALFMVIMLAGYALGVYFNARHGALRVYTLGVGAVGLVGTAILLESLGWFKAPKILEKLGDASYTLYLAHLPALWLAAHLGFRNRASYQESWFRESYFLLFLAMLLAGSYVFYRFIELPLYKWSLRFPKKKAADGAK